jgi:hypothetical protein
MHWLRGGKPDGISDGIATLVLKGKPGKWQITRPTAQKENL